MICGRCRADNIAGEHVAACYSRHIEECRRVRVTIRGRVIADLVIGIVSEDLHGCWRIGRREDLMCSASSIGKNIRRDARAAIRECREGDGGCEGGEKGRVEDGGLGDLDRNI